MGSFYGTANELIDNEQDFEYERIQDIFSCSFFIFIALEVSDPARHAGRIKKRTGLDFGQDYQVFD